MSVSVYIEAICAGPNHDKKVKAYKACEEADVSLPDELEEYFEDGFDPSGRVVPLTWNEKVVEGRVESGDGALVDISKLPPYTTHLRVRMG